MSRLIRFLIVEDDEPKRLQLRAFLRSRYEDCTVVEARSLTSGLQAAALQEEQPDVVLLDMTLPNYDVSAHEPGGSTHGFGGKEFLIELPRYGKRMPVIVVTQFKKFGKAPNELTIDDLRRDLPKVNPTSYRGIVSYDIGVRDWQDDLAVLIDDALVGSEPS